MFDIQYPPPNERIILAGLLVPGMDRDLFEEDMQEMVQLCRTAGADVIDVQVQKRDRPVAATYLGSGKLKELRGTLKARKCKTLVIDAELSAGQVRTIEKVIDGKVIDRSQLILDIFAQHARTNEARIQVELAQLRTLYPRLTRAWSHFSQQVGGIGTRGPGEKQLEVDRRLVQRRIADLRNKIRAIERARHTQRKSRKDAYTIALVGYTNVGKSSLLNALCGADVRVENKLFATLDTASRRLFVPEVGNIVLSDTVGFIRKLPHQLVASFMSTLEVVSEADLLMLVLDASSSWIKYQLDTTHEVLKQLGADEVPQLLVLNKADLIADAFARKELALAFPEGEFVSAFAQEDMRGLKSRLSALAQEARREKARAEIIARQTKEMAWGRQAPR
ncbi:MAG: GTPase HflX [Chitinivibrionales bacterium]|nr:GTPase HflX [Chitinivibrionales bacterium]MBD3394178.1 GTPase HflX [Chitinivibrionales bacterium]